MPAEPPPTPILTAAQTRVLRSHVATFTAEPQWHAQMELRAATSTDFRDAITRSRILDGTPLTSDALAELVEIVWKIQNLNAMVLPKLLGTYTYYRRFKDFTGSPQDFAAHMLAKRPDWEPGSLGYEGAPPAEVGEDLAALLQADEHALGPAFERFERHPGVGRAFSTGVLILWDPQRYGLVNNASIGPFKKEGGPLFLAAGARETLRATARRHYGLPEGTQHVAAARTLGWMRLMAEVREACELESFFAVDWLLWRLTSTSKGETAARGPARASAGTARDEGAGYAARVDDWVAAGIAELPDARLSAREQAMRTAHELVTRRLGALGDDELRELARLLNADLTPDGRPAINRFSPAFAGTFLAELVAHAAEANRWIEELWRADGDEAVAQTLDAFWAAAEIPNAGRSFPTAILHARDPERFFPVMPGLARGYQRMTGKSATGRSGTKYVAYCRGIAELRELHRIPVHGVDLVLMQAARADREPSGPVAATAVTDRQFAGFTNEAFRYLADLADNNHDDWVAEHRGRFKAEVREPMRALVGDLGALFVDPVAPDLEHRPKFPETLSNIRKNAHGRGADTYWTHYWAALHRADRKKTEDFQLDVYLEGGFVRWGMRTASAPPEDLARFAQQLRAHPELAARALATARAAGIEVRTDDSLRGAPLGVETVEDLARLVEEQPLLIGRWLPPDQAVAAGPQLADQIADTFRALWPLYALAIRPDPRAELETFFEVPPADAEVPDEEERYDRDRLLADTRISPDLLDDIEALLRDKPQIVLYGPPGTGKTWLAERIAEYLVRDGGDTKTVQFHPSYGYEDFVEGIRPVPDPAGGTVTYRVEAGIFRRFCDEARRHPKRTYVLVIDEINRGNLPRVFGELLYCLERRGSERPVELPVSRESFWVPKNLLVIGTMNTADQSIALIDVALRRRFHFAQLQPDADVLRSWLADHAPAMLGVADVLDALNGELVREGLDANLAIGHSHFMRPGLDEPSLRRVWSHSVVPTLEDYFYGKPKKIDRFRYEEFVEHRLASASADDDVSLDADDVDEADTDE